jgi:hypothetical protein
MASAIWPPVRTVRHALIGGKRARPDERRLPGGNPAKVNMKPGWQAKRARPDVEQPMIEDELNGRGEAPGYTGAHPIAQAR